MRNETRIFQKNQALGSPMLGFFLSFINYTYFRNIGNDNTCFLLKKVICNLVIDNTNSFFNYLDYCMGIGTSLYLLFGEKLFVELIIWAKGLINYKLWLINTKKQLISH
jgi:hypothetical protein